MAYDQVQLLALGCVWLGIAISGVVLFEPAPVDVMWIGLVFLLPMAGLCAFTPSLLVLFGMLMLFVASIYLTAIGSDNIGVTALYNSITLYLCLACIVFAGFVYKNPRLHLDVIFSAYTFAAVVAAVAALIGYFNILPGADAMFTKYGRAAGTFKDPNVFGPFLVPVILYLFHVWLKRTFIRGLLPAMLLMFLVLALLLSFSRGAWVHLLISLGLFVYLSYVTAPSPGQRLKIVSLVVFSALAAMVVIAGALQLEKVRDLFEERASLSQSYDIGPLGRFGGQKKAVDILLQNPQGIGVGVFAERYHHEQPHNSYLTVFLRGGWLGGLMYLFIICLTLGLGYRHVLRDTPTRPMFLVLLASFTGLCLENLLLDTDHWRHFYLLLGLLWGVMAAEGRERETALFAKPFEARGARRRRAVVADATA